jgi:nucleoside-diphosphate kinase
VISRFEDAGLKIVGMKMRWVDKRFAEKHYTDDLARRRGSHVRKWMMDYLTEGPVVAVVLEGLHAVEAVRKICGSTEPRTAAPGTIRGDFCHTSYEWADKKRRGIRNIIHASGSRKEAEYEIYLWFNKDELHSYKTVHEKHTL